MTGAELVFERRDQAQRNEQQRSLTDEVDPIAGGIDSRRESDRTYRRQAKQECCKHGLPFAQCMPGSDDGCCHHACNRECGPRRQRIGARRARRRPTKVRKKVETVRARICCAESISATTAKPTEKQHHKEGE